MEVQHASSSIQQLQICRAVTGKGHTCGQVEQVHSGRKLGMGAGSSQATKKIEAARHSTMVPHGLQVACPPAPTMPRRRLQQICVAALSGALAAL